MKYKLSDYLHVQPIGQRIVKTSVAVTLCLLFYMLRGYRGEDMPAEAAITAIICMHPFVRGARESAASRLFGTLIGAFWGFGFLVLVPLLHPLNRTLWALYPLMGVGTLIALYSAVLIKKPEASGLAAIVFVCVVVNYPAIDNPMEQAFHRILDVLVGTTIALAVNAIRLPRKKLKNRVFFVRLDALAGNRFSTLPATVLYRLHYLFSDGAKICLMSEHAPSFLPPQLDAAEFTVPMIVMDGAAIYDLAENVYRSITAMDTNSCRWLMKRLDGIGAGYFIYTVHRDRNCIFRHGPMNEAENAVYQRLKRSPYRYYLDQDHFPMADVVCLKLVGGAEQLEHIRRQLEPSLAKMKLRAALRAPDRPEEGRTLCFYAANADMPHAEARLMHLLRQTEPDLVPVDLSAEKDGTEYDAIRLMRRIGRAYEPTLLAYALQKNKEQRA